MPFRSQAQRKFLYSQHPDIAKRWSKEFPNQKNLPKKVKHKFGLSGFNPFKAGGDVHQNSQSFITGAKANGASSFQAQPGGDITPKYKRMKRKLGVKTSKPGDLLKAYKIKVNNKSRDYGSTDLKKKVISINKKRIKTHPLHKKQYPELADSLYHETYHAKNPQATEKETYKATHHAMKTMGTKQKSKLYGLLK